MDEYVKRFLSLIQDDLKDTSDILRRNVIIYILAKVEMKSFFPPTILWIDASPEVFEGMLMDRVKFLSAATSVYISLDSYELAERTAKEKGIVEEYKKLFSEMVY